MPSPSNTLLSLPGGAALRGLHLGALRRRRAPTSCTAKQIWVCVESMDMGYSQLLSWLLLAGRMRKGLHPQMQWISYVTQSGRLINIMMTKVNHTGKVYHMRAKRQMAQSLGQIAKFKRRYEQEAEENKDK
ncbi:uncharacterized protein LOC101758071 isoform X2 [Setaria italica]|nr:uncharacterized protein LOC101758071 isoform X2 [Setaria italica]